MERLLKCTAVTLPSKSVEIIGVAARRSALASAKWKGSGRRARIAKSSGWRRRNSSAARKPSTSSVSPPGASASRQCRSCSPGVGIAIGIVGMDAEAHGGEGEIVGIGQRDHVEELAVIGDPHMAEAIAHRRHLPLLDRHLVQQGKAVSGEARQQAQLFGGIGQHRGPIGLRQIVGDLRPPEPRLAAGASPAPAGERSWAASQPAA